MKTFLKENWFKLVIAFVILLIGFSFCYYFVIFIPKKEKLKTETEIEKSKQILVPIQNQQKSDESLELVLTNYKIDVQDSEDARNSLLNVAFNSPHQSCPSIIANKTTKQHLYYFVLDDLNSLEVKYGKYKNDIPYIKNSLDNLWKTIEMTKDQCESIGVKIE